jgi:hypothetical protein
VLILVAVVVVEEEEEMDVVVEVEEEDEFTGITSSTFFLRGLKSATFSEGGGVETKSFIRTRNSLGIFSDVFVANEKSSFFLQRNEMNRR